MIKHLQSLASSRDLTCRKLKKKNMIKQLSEFKTVKTFIGSLMVKQTNKKNPGFCIERWESKISVFSFSINLMSHMYLATSERTQPSQVPSVLVWLWILGQNSFVWLWIWVRIVFLEYYKQIQSIISSPAFIFFISQTSAWLFLWWLLGMPGNQRMT